jgi:hypothetical protein
MKNLFLLYLFLLLMGSAALANENLCIKVTNACPMELTLFGLEQIYEVKPGESKTLSRDDMAGACTTDRNGISWCSVFVGYPNSSDTDAVKALFPGAELTCEKPHFYSIVNSGIRCVS